VLRVIEVRAGRFLVESDAPDHVARYWVDPNGIACECPGSRYGRMCAHLRHVLDELEAGARAV